MPKSLEKKMGEEGEGNAKESKTTSSTSWQSYLDIPRSFQESTDTAIRSARSLQQSSSTHLRSLQDLLPQLRSQYDTYEDAFFHKVKDELFVAKQYPALAAGIALTAGLLLMRGPRRFLFRHTFGRFRSEEAQFVRAEKNVKELSLSVEVMRNESRKLIERAALAEKDMKLGQSDLMNAGAHIRSLSRTAYKAEAEATDLMDLLREIPGREALKLRADVASMASYLRQQRILMDKKILKISELGVPV